jgi:CPA1 family monovalent cation:H+ antiporter
VSIGVVQGTEGPEGPEAFRRELLGAERAALLELRNQGRLSDETRRRAERDLDLEDARLEI